ncbi:hypothetical protein H312_03232 [Anncaliia algerae PRA339]|uniref:Centromere protein J C-terminal domain-containing protein n=1 Tax=Anncaliia algerae PRA339 TaxID=1288291 RepID=A0A059EWF5_9MICR|nr:hypothetical protein H312_03232 [Anncaliia algerae PRA339]
MSEDLFLQQVQIQECSKFIEQLLSKIEKNDTNIKEILRDEIERLKILHIEYKQNLESKKVIHEEKQPLKTRYFLKDGSTYVVDSKGNYKYLYDNKNRSITYHFTNGQIEKTFENGIKEIRYPDGSICIKFGDKDYDFYK